LIGAAPASVPPALLSIRVAGVIQARNDSYLAAEDPGSGPAGEPAEGAGGDPGGG